MRSVGDPILWEALETQLHAGAITLRTALTRQAATIRCSLDEADELLARMVVFDPTFSTFVTRLEAAGAALAVVSAGVSPLIERAMARNGLGRVVVHANDVSDTAEGWRVTFRDDSANGHDKAAAVRAAHAAGSRTVYIGDGISDYEAALAADYRFAKRGRSLETYLQKEKAEYVAFSAFSELLLGAQLRDLPLQVGDRGL